MKKLYFTKSLFMAVLVFALSAGTLIGQDYSGGTGTEADPWLISEVQDLLDLDTARAQWDTVNYYLLTADLDMKGQTFKPMGYDNGAKLYFRGTIDGGNHVIKNLNITQHDDAAASGGWNMGFMGIAEAAQIKNLGLDSLSMATANKIGAFIGEGRWGCKISNSFVINSTISAGSGGYVGAAVGASDGIIIENCLFEAEVIGGWRVGGITGVQAWGSLDLNAVVVYQSPVNGDAILGSLQNNVQPFTWENVYYRNNGQDRAGDTVGVEVNPADFLTQATYAGFSFDTAWAMKTDGFAILSSFPTSVFEHLEGFSNEAPVANAGISKTVEINTEVELDGSGSSDSDGDDITFVWKAPAGITLSDVNDTNPTFTPTAAGKLTFKLVVNDGVVDSDTSMINITVVDAIPTDTLKPTLDWVAECPQSEREPAANAIDGLTSTMFTTDWEDSSIDFPIEFIVELGGKTAEITHFIYVPRQDAYGPNGTVREYEFYVSDSKTDWGTAVATDTFDFPNFVDGISKELYKPEKLVKLATPATGKFIKFSCMRTINSNLDPAKPKIEMTMAEFVMFGQEVNAAPVADAGADQTVEGGATVTLDGSGSDDADGDALTYTWTAPAGITLSATDVVGPTFTAPDVTEDTEYKIALVVNDGTVDSASDTVVVTVEYVSAVKGIDALTLEVYPNPSNGVFTVVSKAAAELVVTDLVGRVVLNDVLFEGENSVNLSAYNKGIYLLTVKEGSKAATMKIKID